MYRNIVIAGATVVALAGVGTAALAASGSDSTSGSAASAQHKQQGKHNGKHGARALLRHAVHGSIVTHGKDGYVTHSAIRGTVTSVSASAITVKAADGFVQTFTIGSDTKVRAVSGAKGHRTATASTIAKVASGDAVGVLGKAPESSHATAVATAVIDGIRLKK